MSTELDKKEREVRETLIDVIKPDGSLRNLHTYINWERGEDEVTLDAAFTSKELEAIAWWMEHMGGK